MCDLIWYNRKKGNLTKKSINSTGYECAPCTSNSACTLWCMISMHMVRLHIAHGAHAPCQWSRYTMCKAHQHHELGARTPCTQPILSHSTMYKGHASHTHTRKFAPCTWSKLDSHVCTHCIVHQHHIYVGGALGGSPSVWGRPRRRVRDQFEISRMQVSCVAMLEHVAITYGSNKTL